ncbi:hypothetical protein ACVIHB_005675 [Bradyrhizobium liaoningense]
MPLLSLPVTLPRRAAFGVEDIAENAKQRFEIVVPPIGTRITDSSDRRIRGRIAGRQPERSRQSLVGRLFRGTVLGNAKESHVEKARCTDINYVKNLETPGRSLGNLSPKIYDGSL